MDDENSSQGSKKILTGSSMLESGQKAGFGLFIILIGQIVNIVMIFSKPSSDSNIESYLDYVSFFETISVLIAIANIIGIILILQDLKELLDELQEDRDIWNQNLMIIASEINKK